MYTITVTGVSIWECNYLDSEEKETSPPLESKIAIPHSSLPVPIHPLQIPLRLHLCQTPLALTLAVAVVGMCTEDSTWGPVKLS